MQLPEAGMFLLPHDNLSLCLCRHRHLLWVTCQFSNYCAVINSVDPIKKITVIKLKHRNDDMKVQVNVSALSEYRDEI